MFYYVKNNIKKNLTRYIFTFLIFIVSIMFVNFLSQLVHNMNIELDKKLISASHKTDIKGMMDTMNIFKYVIIGFCYIMVKNTYSIILQGRLKEFKLLHNLGVSTKKIRKMLYGEMTFISIISLIIALPLGLYLSLLFMKKYDFGDGHISFLALGLIAIFTVLASLLITVESFKLVIPSILDNENKTNNVAYWDKKTKSTNLILFIIGAVLIVISKFNIGKFQYEYFYRKKQSIIITQSSVQSILEIVGILLCFNFGIYILVWGLDAISKKLKLKSLYIAMEQKLYNFKGTKNIITSCLIAIIAIVTTFGMYNSSRKSAEGYVDNTIYYDNILIVEQGINKKEDDIKAFSKALNKGNNIVPALILKVKSEENKTRLLTGINKEFFNIEKVEPLKNEREDIFKGTELNAIISNIDVKDGKIKVGEETKYTMDDKTVKVKISDSQRTANMQQVLVDKNKLSKTVYGVEGINNALYLKGLSEKDIGNLVKFLETDKYSITNISDIKETYRTNIIKGTEVIEAFLYVLLIYTIFLILNMFLLSFEERIKQFATLRVIGVKKRTLMLSMILESLIIFILGSFIALPLGISSMKEAIKYVEKVVDVPISMHIPIMQFSAILGGSTFIVFIITLMISVFITKKNYTDYLYRE